MTTTTAIVRAPTRNMTRLAYATVGLTAVWVVAHAFGVLGPVDAITLEINPAYGKLSGASHELLGKRLREVVPTIEDRTTRP